MIDAEKVRNGSKVTPVIWNADFELSDKYFMRDEEGKTYVHIDDSSVSPDGDTIGRRVWTIYYDKDNNGEFDESEGTVISDENEAAVDYTTENVGRYKVSITVYETFDDTIPKLLTEDAYLHDDTSGKAVSAMRRRRQRLILKSQSRLI